MVCHTEEGGARAWHVVASEERGIPVGHGMSQSSLLLDVEDSLNGLAIWSCHDTFEADGKVPNSLIVDCHVVTILYIMMRYTPYTLYLDKSVFLWYNYSSRIVVLPCETWHSCFLPIPDFCLDKQISVQSSRSRSVFHYTGKQFWSFLLSVGRSVVYLSEQKGII